MALRSGFGDPTYAIERERVATMLAPLDDQLPSCRRLAQGDDFAEPGSIDNRGTTVEAVTREALRELAALMRARR